MIHGLNNRIKVCYSNGLTHHHTKASECYVVDVVTKVQKVGYSNGSVI